MKDIQGRTVVIGNTILYAAGAKLHTGVVTNMEDDKITVDIDGGGTSTFTVTEDKIYLLG